MKDLTLTEDDARRIYSLWWISDPSEFTDINDPSHRLYYKRVDLDEEYTATLPIRDFAIDALRSSLRFLNEMGMTVTDDAGQRVDLADPVIDIV